MKKKLNLFPLMAVIILLALSFSINVSPSKADEPIEITHDLCQPPIDLSVGFAIRCPLSDLTRWKSIPEGGSTFNCEVYVAVGNGDMIPSTSTNIAPINQDLVGFETVPFPCKGMGKIVPPARPGPVDFHRGYLSCRIPNIADIANHIAGRQVLEGDYIDSWNTINSTSHAILRVNVAADGSGVIFDHPTMHLEKLQDAETRTALYQAGIFETLGQVSSECDPNKNSAAVYSYYPTWNSSLCGDKSNPCQNKGVSISDYLKLQFELWEYEARWNEAIKSRAGQFFIWQLSEVEFTIGNGFDGFIADLEIDPRTSQGGGG